MTAAQEAEPTGREAKASAPDKIAADTLHRVVRGYRMVVLVDVHDARFVRRQFGLVVRRVADHDDAVAGLDEARRRAVQDDVARPTRHRVRRESSTVVDVEHVHLLELADVGEVHQRRIERDRSHVVETRPRHRCPVHLRLQHRALHGHSLMAAWSSATATLTLSINLVTPTRAASAISTSPSSFVSGVSSCASRTSTYSGSTSGSVSMVLRTVASTRAASRSPSTIASAAACSARDNTSA